MNAFSIKSGGFKLILAVFLIAMTVSCSHEKNENRGTPLSLEKQITNLQTTIAAQDTLSEQEVALLENLKEYTADRKPSVSVGEQNHSFNFDDLSRTHIEFNSIEEPPVFESCKNAGNPAAEKACVAAKVAAFVAANFDLNVGKDLKVAGVHEIDVSFVIDTQGNIKDIKTRYAEPSLEGEAARVISQLPKMIPGKHHGKPMASLYSLPILYKVPS